jgi:urease accessory protein
MRACAQLVAEPDGRGGTRLATLRGESPLLLRRSTDERPGVATVFLVGGAAGPLGGDDLHLDIVVRAGAALCLRTAAASLALPARSGAPSRTVVTVSVGAGGRLWYLPEQLVAGAGCRHSALSTVELAEDAALVWREELICGRYAEQPGDTTITTQVTRAGRPLLRQSLAVGPDAPGWASSAVLGGAKATGSLLSVNAPSDVEGESPQVLGPTAVRVPLPGGAWLTTATAPDAHTLRGYLSEGSTS